MRSVGTIDFTFQNDPTAGTFEPVTRSSSKCLKFPKIGPILIWFCGPRIIKTSTLRSMDCMGMPSKFPRLQIFCMRPWLSSGHSHCEGHGRGSVWQAMNDKSVINTTIRYESILRDEKMVKIVFFLFGFFNFHSIYLKWYVNDSFDANNWI